GEDLPSRDIPGTLVGDDHGGSAGKERRDLVGNAREHTVPDHDLASSRRMGQRLIDERARGVQGHGFSPGLPVGFIPGLVAVTGFMPVAGAMCPGCDRGLMARIWSLFPTQATNPLPRV